MYIPLTYEKMYARKKIDEYNLPSWFSNFVLHYIFIKYFLFLPLCGLALYIVFLIVNFDISFLLLLSTIYISLESKDFPLNNYLVYSLDKNISFSGVYQYRKTFYSIYFYFLAKMVYKYIVIFMLPFFMFQVELQLIIFSFITSFFLIVIFMNLSSCAFYRKYMLSGGMKEANITKFLFKTTLYFVTILLLFNTIRFEAEINFTSLEIDHSKIYQILIPIMFIILLLSTGLHNSKVIKNLGKQLSIQNRNISYGIQTIEFKSLSYFLKDFTLLKRTFNNKLLYLKFMIIVQITLLSIVPLVLKTFISDNDIYIIFSVIAIALAFSNIKVDYIKKIISPDIDFTSVPLSVVQKIKLNDLFVQKILFYIILSLYPTLISFIVLIVNVQLWHSISASILILIIYINMGMASTLGAILFPKMNPEADYEIGNSQKANFFENIFLYSSSVLISIVFIQDLLFGEMQYSVDIYLILVVVFIQLIMLLMAKLYLRNTKIKDVLQNGD